MPGICYIEVTGGIAEHGPDVFLVRVIEFFRLHPGRHAIDFSIRRSRGINAIMGVDGYGVDFESIEFGDFLCLACRWNAIEPRAGSAGCVEIAARIARQCPKIGARRIPDFTRFGRERKPPIAANGEVVPIALLEIGVIGLQPGFRLCSETGDGQKHARPHREEKTMIHLN